MNLANVASLLRENWAVVVAIASATSAVGVFVKDMFTIRKLRADLKVLREADQLKESRIQVATVDEIIKFSERYGRERIISSGGPTRQVIGLPISIQDNWCTSFWLRMIAAAVAIGLIYFWGGIQSWPPGFERNATFASAVLLGVLIFIALFAIGTAVLERIVTLPMVLKLIKEKEVDVRRKSGRQRPALTDRFRSIQKRIEADD